MTKPSASVLVVDDDPAVGTVLGALLRQDGLSARSVLSGDEALTLLQSYHVDVVITDLRMPAMNGMALLSEISKRWPGTPVVMLTAHGTVSAAVEAMKIGAADFLLKPFDREQILYVVRKALASSKRTASSAPDAPQGDDIIGDSRSMKEVFELIRRAAPGTATVLIRGETGTGKDLVARAIHEQSPRSGGPLVKVQCSGLPEALLESELFGYERGAFTGATSRKPGRFELADGGTLFLDEIGDIDLAMQVKLLRVLQDRQFERLGGTKTLSANVRFVSATHRDLETSVNEGAFREDLFYRLNVIPIWIPPLRERADDIGPLAHHFCRTFGETNLKPQMTLDRRAIEALTRQAWPGNVRQLQNLIERLVVLSDGPTIGEADVDRELTRDLGSRPQRKLEQPPEETLDDRRRTAEREAVETALDRCRGNRTQAARVLGISRRTLYNKLQEFDIPSSVGPN